MSTPTFTPEESGAFVEPFDLPPTSTGTLDGLTFAIKDIFDVAGYRTGCGNPTWRDTHPPAASHAVCVDQLLTAGARGIGKTVTDELAFSLLGANHFYGTPLNAKAPDRFPGGSSSGSASAVACGFADFALGSDTGGSVRAPASNCGILGWRPSLGMISLAGVMPLSPSFDTVGIFTRETSVLCRVASVLLAQEIPDVAKPETIHLLDEGRRLADENVTQALSGPIQQIRDRFSDHVRQTSVNDIVGESEPDLYPWFQTYRQLMGAEAWSLLGAWIEAVKPEFGPAMTDTIKMARGLDRRETAGAIARREKYFRRLHTTLGPRDVMIIPTSPTLVPRKSEQIKRDQARDGFYPRWLGFTAIAGVGRLPQISLPLGESEGVPIGLSLIGSWGSDPWLLGFARRVMEMAG